jgi:hypothetical protein
MSCRFRENQRSIPASLPVCHSKRVRPALELPALASGSPVLCSSSETAISVNCTFRLQEPPLASPRSSWQHLLPVDRTGAGLRAPGYPSQRSPRRPRCHLPGSQAPPSLSHSIPQSPLSACSETAGSESRHSGSNCLPHPHNLIDPRLDWAAISWFAWSDKESRNVSETARSKFAAFAKEHK